MLLLDRTYRHGPRRGPRVDPVSVSAPDSTRKRSPSFDPLGKGANDLDPYTIYLCSVLTCMTVHNSYSLGGPLGDPLVVISIGGFNILCITYRLTGSRIYSEFLFQSKDDWMKLVAEIACFSADEKAMSIMKVR